MICSTRGERRGERRRGRGAERLLHRVQLAGAARARHQCARRLHGRALATMHTRGARRDKMSILLVSRDIQLLSELCDMQRHATVWSVRRPPFPTSRRAVSHAASPPSPSFCDMNCVSDARLLRLPLSSPMHLLLPRLSNGNHGLSAVRSRPKFRWRSIKYLSSERVVSNPLLMFCAPATQLTDQVLF